MRILCIRIFYIDNAVLLQYIWIRLSIYIEDLMKAKSEKKEKFKYCCFPASRMLFHLPVLCQAPTLRFELVPDKSL